MTRILTPQIMKDAPMIVVSFKADPAVLRSLLPPRLDPHPAGRVVLNMWDQDDPGSSSGFGQPGPVSVTYLAIEVAGHDTSTADGAVSAPGRYFAGQWISDADGGGFRRYGAQEAGVGADVGETRYERDGTTLTATLTVAGEECIRLSARVGDRTQATVGGHLNYFCDRPSRGGVEIARIGVPFVFEVAEAEVTDIRFSPSLAFKLINGRPAMELAPTMPLSVESVMYGKATWAPFRVAETWSAATAA